MESIRKYPRTRHIEGSRLQAGDEDLSAVSFATLAGRNLVVEEKMDGANCGVSFSASGELRLQSRGHYLTGGPREKHFNLFKQWATRHAAMLYEVLGTRYVMYGEWLYAKHTVYYNALPHYFMEFDILDTREDQFLSTSRRREMFAGRPLVSVAVLGEGIYTKLKDLTSLIGPSLFLTEGHIAELGDRAEELGLDRLRALKETDCSTAMEGLYIKVEEQGIVRERYKFVRADFLAAVFAAEGHWLNRPIIPNLLRDGVDLFAEEL